MTMQKDTECANLFDVVDSGTRENAASVKHWNEKTLQKRVVNTKQLYMKRTEESTNRDERKTGQKSNKYSKKMAGC